LAKKGKTALILEAITPDQNIKYGIKVEHLIQNEMKYIVNKYIYKYRKAVFDTFGWDTDDLLQQVRLVLWKGVATFDTSKKAKIETYCSTMLYYAFLNISKKCKTYKHSLSKLYCPEEMFESEELIFYETGEDWVRYAQSFKVLMNTLTDNEQKVIVRYLVHGESTIDISKQTKIKKTEVIYILKNIKIKLTQYLGD